MCSLLSARSSRYTLDSIRARYAQRAAAGCMQPCLDIIQANEREESNIYIRQKMRALAHVRVLASGYVARLVGG